MHSWEVAWYERRNTCNVGIRNAELSHGFYPQPTLWSSAISLFPGSISFSAQWESSDVFPSFHTSFHTLWHMQKKKEKMKAHWGKQRGCSGMVVTSAGRYQPPRPGWHPQKCTQLYPIGSEQSVSPTVRLKKVPVRFKWDNVYKTAFCNLKHCIFKRKNKGCLRTSVMDRKNWQLTHATLKYYHWPEGLIYVFFRVTFLFLWDSLQCP